MASERGDELHYSAVRVRPTATGWSVLIGVALVAFVAASSRVSYGFLLVVLGVAIVDLVLTRRGFTTRRIRMTPLVLTAESPQQLAVTVSAPKGIPLTIAPLPFSELDGLVASTVEQLDGDMASVPVYFSDGELPSVKRHVRFVVSASALGLVNAQQTVAYVGSQFFHRIPEVPSLLDRVNTVSVDEVGRLRGYLPGDRRSRVSWLATARTGSLHVRDSLIAEDDEVVVVAQVATLDDLDEPETLLEKLVESAAATSSVVADLLDQGVRVTLRTVEIDDEVHELIESQIKTDPTVAMPSLPDGASEQVHVVEREVADRSELIRRIAHMEIGAVPPPSGPHLFVDRAGIRSVA